MNRVVETMTELIRLSVMDKNHIPFNDFSEGGKEEEIFHKATIEWNGHFLEIIGDVAIDALQVKTKKSSFQLKYLKESSLDERMTVLTQILDLLFPIDKEALL